jgi:hypothetical protein
MIELHSGKKPLTLLVIDFASGLAKKSGSAVGQATGTGWPSYTSTYPSSKWASTKRTPREADRVSSSPRRDAFGRQTHRANNH